MNRIPSILVALIAIAVCGTAQAGPYLDQTPPGDAPELFAPGVVCTGWGDRDLIISPDGNEIYFGLLDRAGVGLRVTRQVDGRWTEPVIAAFSVDSNYGCLEPTMSADGERICFLSTRPIPDEDDLPGWGNQNIFAVDRTAEGWSDPYPLPGAVNTLEGEYYPSLTRDGTLYYTSDVRGQASVICRSRLVDGQYAEPEQLPDHVNSGTANYNAFIDPQERYLIVCIAGLESNLGASDYYIAFRGADDRWSDPINLGETINGPDTRAGSAYVSPDGKYLFFSAMRSDDAAFFPDGVLTVDGLRKVNGSPRNGGNDIYWMKADFLETLRPEGF